MNHKDLDLRCDILLEVYSQNYGKKDTLVLQVETWTDPKKHTTSKPKLANRIIYYTDAGEKRYGKAQGIDLNGFIALLNSQEQIREALGDIEKKLQKEVDNEEIPF